MGLYESIPKRRLGTYIENAKALANSALRAVVNKDLVASAEDLADFARDPGQIIGHASWLLKYCDIEQNFRGSIERFTKPTASNGISEGAEKHAQDAAAMKLSGDAFDPSRPLTYTDIRNIWKSQP